jgi:O-antigen/teichoic acid export membrane protein
MFKPGSIAHNAALTVIFLAISSLASISLGIGIARVDGPLGRGIWAYAAVTLGLCAVFAEGAFNAVLAQYKTDGLPGPLVYRAMLRVTAWASLILGGSVAVWAVSAPGQGMLLAVALALPFALYTGTAVGFLTADGHVQETNAINAVTVLGVAAIALPLLIFKHVSVTVVLGVWVGSYALAALATFVLTRNYACGSFDARALADTTKRHVSFAFASGAVFFVTYLNKRVDLFIVGMLRGPVALGWYSLGVAAGEILWRWSEALNWAAFGSIAAATPERAGALTAQLTRTIFFLQGACVTLLFVIAPWLIPTVWGKKFMPSVAVVQMLIPGILAYSLETTLGFFIMVRLKRPKTNLIIQSCSTLACAVLTLLFLPRYGLPGAAAATSITYTATTIACAVIFLQAARMPVSHLLLPSWNDLKSLARKRDA